MVFLKTCVVTLPLHSHAKSFQNFLQSNVTKHVSGAHQNAEANKQTENAVKISRGISKRKMMG